MLEKVKDYFFGCPLEEGIEEKIEKLLQAGYVWVEKEGECPFLWTDELTGQGGFFEQNDNDVIHLDRNVGIVIGVALILGERDEMINTEEEENWVRSLGLVPVRHNNYDYVVIIGREEKEAAE